MSDEITQDTLDVERPPFAMVPEALLFDASISPTARTLYGILQRHGTTPDRCFPGYERLGTLLGRSPRSMARIVAELVDSGWLVKSRRRISGVHTSNAYTLKWRPDAQICDPPPRTDARHHDASVRATTAHECAHNEKVFSESQSNETQALALHADAARSDAPTFDAFWEAYPRRNGRRVGRAQAEAQWKRLKPADRVDALRGAINYAVDCDAGMQIAKDAFRWLRDKLWHDYQEATRPTARARAKDPMRRGGPSLTDRLQAVADNERQQAQLPQGGRP